LKNIQEEIPSHITAPDEGENCYVVKTKSKLVDVIKQIKETGEFAFNFERNGIFSPSCILICPWGCLGG